MAEFPNNLPRRGYHVADVTAEGMVMLIVNHNVTYSNLYISDIVSEHEVSSLFNIYVVKDTFKAILKNNEASLMIKKYNYFYQTSTVTGTGRYNSNVLDSLGSAFNLSLDPVPGTSIYEKIIEIKSFHNQHKFF